MPGLLERIMEEYEDPERRARLFRIFYIISLIVVLFGYVIILFLLFF